MIFNPVYGGSSAPNLGSKTITANGTYLASSDNLDGYDEVTVNVSADPKIYTGENEDYVFETAGELICTLSNRAYTKTTADKAYVAYFTSTGNYTQPVLVSKIADGVKYTALGTTFSYQGTFTYGGETYYYSKTEYAMSGNLTSTAGRGLKLTGTYATAVAAGEALLDLALGGGVVKFTANGSYPVPTGYDGYGDIEVDVSPTLQSKTGISITENGSFSFTPDNGYDGLSLVSGTVNVSGGGGGGGSTLQCFELYGAGFNGYTQDFKGVLDNQYFTCFYHDNMYNTYTLNGASGTYSTAVNGLGSGMLYGTALAITNNIDASLNAIINKGTSFQSRHYDSGSYMTVVGGWVGYPSGGTIYESAKANTTSNAITMSSAHSKLLVLVCASGTGMASVATVDINGTTYDVTNMGAKYDSMYALYAAIEISGNTATTITSTWSVSCYNYMSIIGIDAA